MLLERFARTGCAACASSISSAARSAAHDNRDAVARLARAARNASARRRDPQRGIAERWLALGIERVVVGSRAATDPSDVAAWLREIGGTRIVLAFDVRIDTKGIPRLATHGWETQTQTSLWDAVELYAEDGLQHVLCTDVSRDGSLTGPNVGLRKPPQSLSASRGRRRVASRRTSPLLPRPVWPAISGRAARGASAHRPREAHNPVSRRPRRPGRRGRAVPRSSCRRRHPRARRTVTRRGWRLVLRHHGGLRQRSVDRSGCARRGRARHPVLRRGRHPQRRRCWRPEPVPKISVIRPRSRPSLIDELARRFSSQCVVAGVDSRTTDRGPGCQYTSVPSVPRRTALDWVVRSGPRHGRSRPGCMAATAYGLTSSSYA